MTVQSQIEQLEDYMNDELHGAKLYAETAVNIPDKTLSEHFTKMANEEIGHFEALCEMTKKILTSADPAEAEKMKVLYDFEKKGQSKKIAEIKTLLSML